VATVLAAVLPSMINHLTPKGEVPATPTLEGQLGSLLSSFGLGR